jgi:hypothetical protein
VLEQIGYAGTTGFRVSLGDGADRSHLDALVGVLSGTVGELRQMEAASTEALSRFSPPTAG